MIRALLIALALLTAPAEARTLSAAAPMLTDSGLLQETRLYYGKMTTGTTITRNFVIDTFIRCYQTAGLWTKTDILYLHAANAQQTGLLNLKSPGTFTLTAVASITFTANQGFTGNGVDMYLSSTWNYTSSAVTYTQNSAHLSVWVFSNAAGADTFEIGNDAAGGGSARIVTRSSTDNVSARLNDATSFTGAAGGTAVGNTTVSRRASNDREIYRNAGSLATDATASTAVPTSTFAVLKTGSIFSARQVSISSAGGGLTDTEVSDMYTCRNNYMGAL